MTRPIFFLTDFGLSDTYVGVVKAVILTIAPDARIVDLTHGIPPQDVRAGAFALLTAVPYLPKDAVVLAVVDPGVGTNRRPIAVQAGGRIFVGPDNGLLSWALAAPTETPPRVVRPTLRRPLLRLADGLSGVLLDRPDSWLPMVSASFHGRDVFGPVAAHLAAGTPLAALGSSLTSTSIAAFCFPEPDQRSSGVLGQVVYVDRFGNLVTSLMARDLPPDPVVMVRGRAINGLAEHFQVSAPLIALIGSAGFLEIAVPNGSAAALLQVGAGEPVHVGPGEASGTIRA